MTALGRRLWRALLATVLPARCAVCGTLFPPALDGRGGPPAHLLSACGFAWLMAPQLCPGCRTGFHAAAAPLCPRCGRGYPDPGAMDHLCGECLRQPGPIDKARAAAIHTGPLPAVIHSLKYRRRLQLARPLGRLLAAAFAHHWQPGEIDAVLPVPLHPRRMRQRGFNQTYLLLRRGWKNGGALPPVARGLLQRWRATPPQTGLERAARLENTRGAFRVPLPQTVAGRSLLLVDDVRTTGATAAACAGALLAAGARRVDLLTLSRVER